MNLNTARFSLMIRIMILAVCCVLFQPQTGTFAKQNTLEVIHSTSMTLAITGISNPVSSLKTLSESGEGSLRSSKRFSYVSPDREGMHLALPVASLHLPDLLFYGWASPFSVFLPPLSRRTLSWFALAPPHNTADRMA